MLLSKYVPRDGVCIDGRFVYTTKQKPSGEGHTKTEAYVDDQRRLDSRSCVKGFQEASGANVHAPTAQLQSSRAPLSEIAFRKWNLE